MTVVNPKSISGITSITTASGSDNLLTIHTNNGTERLRIDSTGATKIVTGIVTTLTATTGIVTNFTANAVNIGIDTGVYGENLVVTGNARVTGITTFGTSNNPAFMLNIDDSSGTSTISIPDSIIHSGDTDTKIRFPSADTFSVETGGSQAFRVNSNGEFIMADTSTKTFIDLETTDSNTRALISAKGKDSSGGDVTLKIGAFGDTQRGEIFTHSNHDLGFATNNAATQFKMKTSGNLEIVNGDLKVASGHGIDFSATANAGSPSSATSEVFDDYEEGTWVPGLSGSDGITGQTYTSRNGFYTKIGNRVYCDFSFVINAKGNYSGTYIQLVNLPFPINGSSYTRSNCTPIYYRTLNNRWCFLGLQGHEGQSKCYVFGVEGPGSGADGASNRSYPDGSDIANSTEMTGSFSYLAE